jgi:hypothetical protein
MNKIIREILLGILILTVVLTALGLPQGVYHFAKRHDVIGHELYVGTLIPTREHDEKYGAVIIYNTFLGKDGGVHKGVEFTTGAGLEFLCTPSSDDPLQQLTGMSFRVDKDNDLYAYCAQPAEQ